MVIDSHVSGRIGIFNSIFPYDSFFMPLFVFASGYFYKRISIIKNFKHKVKKLIIPYVIWNIAMLCIAASIDKIFNIDWAHIPNFKSFIEMFFLYTLTSLNGPAWFIIMLFWVSVLYNIIYNISKENNIYDIVTTVILFIMGSISVYLCTKGYNTKSRVYLFILRTVFYMQFYHYGYMFKKYIEERLSKYRKFIVCSICITINILLIIIFGDKISFYSTSDMRVFHFWYLPIITSITGIIFYYEVMEFLSKKIGQNKIIDFISRNTFVILQTHLLFANIPNFYVYIKIQQGSTLYSDFNIKGFINSAWIRYSPNTKLIGFFCALIGSLLIAYIIEKVKKYLMRNIKNKRENYERTR